MKPSINQLIQELIAFDPSFLEHEGDLKKILEKLLEADPNIHIDENFRKELKNLLVDQFHSSVKKEKKSISKPFLQNFFYAFGGAVFATLVIVPSLSFNPDLLQKVENLIPSTRDKVESQEKFENQEIKTESVATAPISARPEFAPTRDAVIKNAGNVSEESVAPTNPQAMSVAKVRGMGGGGGGGVATDMAIMAPQEIRYSYSGKPFQIEQKEVEGLVYDQSVLLADAEKVLQNFSFSGVDLSKFSNLDIQNINFVENKKDGYAFSLDSFGNLSISQNYPMWRDAYADCRGDTACIEKLQLTLKDVPSNSELIKVAQDFIQKYSIDTHGYGSPVVQKPWEEYPNPDGSAPYISDVVNLIYPQTIDGKEVFDEQGNPIGIQVSVNIRDKKVTGLWGLTLKKLKKVSFTTESDIKRIQGIAENGGLHMLPSNNESAEVVNMDTPKEVYVRLTEYKNNQNVEYLVPAFSFETLNKPEKASYYKKRIIVPLAQKFLEEKSSSGPIMY